MHETRNKRSLAAISAVALNRIIFRLNVQRRVYERVSNSYQGRLENRHLIAVNLLVSDLKFQIIGVTIEEVKRLTIVEIIAS